MAIKVNGDTVIDDNKNITNVNAATVAGNITLTGGTNTVTGVPSPVNGTDAANKAYVDAVPTSKFFVFDALM